MDYRRSSVALLILAILTPAMRAVRFELQSGRVKCITEDIQINAMVAGRYSVVNPNEGHPLPPSHKITVMVSSPKWTVDHKAEEVERGQFGYTAGETGDYVMCFTAVEHKPEVTMTVDFEWRTGVHARHWSSLPKKTQVEAMEFEVKKMIDSATFIYDEMFYLRGREEEMQDMNIDTNTKMAWLSLVSLLVCMSVAALQLWHLKSFFQKKKLI